MGAAPMHLATGYENRRARIEIVPLMDVIFLLLASFVYATVTLSWARALRVDLPRGQGSALPKSVDVVVIARDGSVWYGDAKVSIGEAVERAAAHYREAGGKVVVRGDRQSELGVAVDLLSRLRAAGVDSVAFEVREDER